LVPIKVGSTNARYASRVKPISHLKANAAEMLTQIAENRNRSTNPVIANMSAV
jgi:hypothetical protein